MANKASKASEYTNGQNPIPQHIPTSSQSQQPSTFSFSPNLNLNDIYLNYWLRQVTLRLRREIYWCWHERGMLNESSSSHYSTTILPPFTNEAIEVVNKSRNWEKRNIFFAKDITMRYLTENIQRPPPRFDSTNKLVRGSFGWVVKELRLDNASIFVLALGIAIAFDSNVESIISSCLNDPLKKRPTLSLAQKLWDSPEEIMRLADAGHPLNRYGLIYYFDRSRSNVNNNNNNFGLNFVDWDNEIQVPSLVANQLLDPKFAPQFLQKLKISYIDDHDVANSSPNDNTTSVSPNSPEILALRISSAPSNNLQIVPICGGRYTANSDLVHDIGKMTRRNIFEFKGDPRFLSDSIYVNSLATLCWLKGIDLYLSKDSTFIFFVMSDSNKKFLDFSLLPLKSIPIIIFLDITDPSQISNLPQDILLPQVNVPNLSYFERVDCWKNALGRHSEGLDEIILESARRFRFEKESITSISKSLKKLAVPITKKKFFQYCRSEFSTDIDKLAQRVTARFTIKDLVLPHKQNSQFQEIINSVQALTSAHYKMGMARAWNESGICILFSGPSGSGKTMAAEILSIELDLPMYRIDLSQVINKYIGETEKNLKLLFDAADVFDIILFFDEADSIFGHRTEAKDANDMHANQQISYLLERIERFKGVSVLSTNRKKDIDEAFARRIRYILEFPFPGESERRKIWDQMIPKSMVILESDKEFLAKQFQLSGGNIRSIILNACLQYTSKSQHHIKDENESNLIMEHIIVAVRREYEKIDRFISLEQFGQYSTMLKRIGYD